MTDTLRAAGNVRVWVHRLEDGAVRLWDDGHNLVVNAGLALLAARLQGSQVPPVSHLAVGTGAIAPAAGDTALGGEVFRDVFTQVTMAGATIVIRNYLGPNDANGFTLREAGLFNTASGPTLYARRLFDTPLVKTADTAATLEWTLTFTAVP